MVQTLRSPTILSTMGIPAVAIKTLVSKKLQPKVTKETETNFPQIIDEHNKLQFRRRQNQSAQNQTAQTEPNHPAAASYKLPQPRP